MPAYQNKRPARERRPSKAFDYAESSTLDGRAAFLGDAALAAFEAGRLAERRRLAELANASPRTQLLHARLLAALGGAA